LFDFFVYFLWFRAYNSFCSLVAQILQRGRASNGDLRTRPTPTGTRRCRRDPRARGGTHPHTTGLRSRLERPRGQVPDAHEGQRCRSDPIPGRADPALPGGAVMDRQTAERFYEWLENEVAEDEQHKVEQQIHMLLWDHHALMEAAKAKAEAAISKAKGE